ncbi:MAG TPA: alpha/beta hydrolase [Fimbriimonadaceae bacterium]|nr:alpha/beta hydrolase [Fimbriimonadaceae bacterium]
MSFIHRFVPGKTPGARTLVMLHGTGGDETSLLEFGPALDPSASILGIRGKSTEEGVNRFFRRFEEGVFDEADILVKAAELGEFLVEAKATYGIGEIVLVGYSNGANMAAALLLLHPEPIDGAVMFRASLPIEPPNKPDLTGKRALLLTGAHDEMTPLSGAHRLADFLAACGCRVDQKVWQAGHGLGRDDVTAAAGWLAAG